MNVRAAQEAQPVHAQPARPVGPALLDSKLTPPPLRPGIQPRSTLLERVTHDPAAIVTVVAPAGYGKSTFLRQLADAEQRGVAWVSIDRTDDDPTILLSYLAAALDRVEPLDEGVFDALVVAGRSNQTAVLARLVSSLWQGSRPTLLVIDDVHLIADRDCEDALAWLSEHLPSHVRMVLASRNTPELPLGRLRARGQLCEVGTRDLALSGAEVDRVLRQAGVVLAPEHVEGITERSEGWPAAVYLASLSMRAGRHLAEGPWRGGGEYVADYVRTEILDQLDIEDRRFLQRTSVLVRLDGALADAVTGGTDGAATLARLARNIQFLVPLDIHGESYRYHHLLQDVLLGEARSWMPDELARSRIRASGWHQAHGDVELAVEYAHDAGDMELVADLVERNGLRMYRAGRIGTVDRWFGWFEDLSMLERHVPLAVIGALLFALLGRTARAERWAAAAMTGTWDGDRLPDGSTDVDGWRSLIGGLLGRHGLDGMRADAARGMRLIEPTGFWRSMALTVAGLTHFLDEDLVGADQVLAQAVDVGVDTGAIPAAVAALSLRGAIAIRRGDWPAVTELHGRAMREIATHHLEGYSACALAYAVGARLAIRRGVPEQARRDLGVLQRMRPLLSAAVPVLSTLVRTEMAHAYLALGDVAGARTVLREAGEIMAARPDLGTLPAQVAALAATTAAAGGGTPGATTLTTAELRLLSYLPSHLTFREIAARLFVSPNTIKTQAIAIYGKLGVSSRGDAITQAVHTGLLDRSLIHLPDDLTPAG